MIIKPYSTIASEDFNTSDYPCVKHFFPCEEASGATVLTDVAGGITITPPSGTFSRSADGHAIDFPSVAENTTAGTWTPATTKKVVFLAVAALATSGNTLRFGKLTQGSSITFTTASNDITTQTVAAETCSTSGGSFTYTSASTIHGRAFSIHTYGAANGGDQYQFTNTTTSTDLGNLDLSATSSGGVAFDQFSAFESGAGGMVIQGNGSVLYGFVMLAFTVLPADLQVGLAWMTAEWARGNKAIYPAWKGLT